MSPTTMKKPSFDMHIFKQKNRSYIYGKEIKYSFECICSVTDIDYEKKDFGYKCLAPNEEIAGRMAWAFLKEQMCNWINSRLLGSRGSNYDLGLS